MEPLTYPNELSIASCNGGGIRGIIPARMLSEIEKRTELASVDCFDIFVGTSAGAIVTAALNCPVVIGEAIPKYRAEDIVSLFKENAATIFPPIPIYKKPITWLSSFFTSKYYTEGLEKVLNNFCGDLLISDSIRDLIIPAAKMPEKEPWWFTNKGIFSKGNASPFNNAFTQKIKIVDVLRATTAAPTYFPYASFEIDKKICHFEDGGLYANNPARIGLTFARAVYGSGRAPLLGCFGTGFPPPDEAMESYYNSGLLHWASEFPEAAMLLENKEVDLEAEIEVEASTFTTGEKERRILSLQPDLSSEDYVLDDSSEKHIEHLLSATEKCIEDNTDYIRAFCEKLVLAHEEKLKAI